MYNIHNFIESISVKEWRYGEDKRKKYLSALLNVKIIYTDFLTKHPECEKDVKYKFFVKYF